MLTRPYAYTRPGNGLPPFQQGGLDSLCGLYSIVNAERFINRSSDEQAQKLFDDMIHYLSRRRMLPKLLTDGIIHTHMLDMMEQVLGRRVIYKEVPWRGMPTPDLDSFWKSMQAFLDGKPGRAIILGLQGIHDHWTVIEMITSRSILLYDSASIKRLPRSSCTTSLSAVSEKRKHLLLPAQTYFLSNRVGRWK